MYVYSIFALHFMVYLFKEACDSKINLYSYNKINVYLKKTTYSIARNKFEKHAFSIEVLLPYAIETI